MDGLKIGNYTGCGNCVLCSDDCDCSKISVPVMITFLKSQQADNWGRFVTVFRQGEQVVGRAVIKDNLVYCASAESNIYENYEDFIFLNDVEIEEINENLQ